MLRGEVELEASFAVGRCEPFPSFAARDDLVAYAAFGNRGEFRIEHRDAGPNAPVGLRPVVYFAVYGIVDRVAYLDLRTEEILLSEVLHPLGETSQGVPSGRNRGRQLYLRAEHAGRIAHYFELLHGLVPAVD